MSVNPIAKKYGDDFLDKFAFAVIKALSKEVLEYNMDDALESLKRLWEVGVVQQYIDKIPELKKLIEMGKLP